MSDKPKKPITAAESLAKMHPSVLSERQISQFQEIGRQHAKIIANIQKITQPITEQMNKIREQVHLFSPMNETIIYNRPVEYDILEELQELNKNRNSPLTSQEDGSIIVYDTKNGSLQRYIGGKCFPYDITENSKRKKLFETLLNRRGYVSTKELMIILSCPSSLAVAKIKQTFNNHASDALRLNKKTELIQGKKGSGYRINPKIHIEKE